MQYKMLQKQLFGDMWKRENGRGEEHLCEGVEIMVSFKTWLTEKMNS